MVTPQGPRVLEYNVRFGDPETQPLLVRLRPDLVDLFEAVAAERLEEMEGKIEWDPRPAVCVVLASKGYPGPYERGFVIDGLGDAAALPDVQVFHAGTKKTGHFVETDGGRVLSVAALGDTPAAAQKRADEAVARARLTGLDHPREIRAP